MLTTTRRDNCSAAFKVVGEIFLCVMNCLLENVVLNAVMFFGFFRVIPAVCRSDEIQFVIAELFISTSASRPAVQHIFSRFAVRGAVSWIYYHKIYALPLNFVREVLRFGLSQREFPA